MSSKKLGQVIKLFISISGESKRTPKEKIELNELGVINDKFYNKSVNRSILISCLSSYTLTKSHNIEIPFGYLGENILLDYNPYKLKIGTHLIIGNVILEITQNCTICNHLAIIDKSITELLKNDRGIFAKVIKSGEIKQEDEVCLEF
jgi:MOSC domain-containing protein YiiM